MKGKTLLAPPVDTVFPAFPAFPTFPLLTMDVTSDSVMTLPVFEPKFPVDEGL